jgi:hypothetical protein
MGDVFSDPLGVLWSALAGMGQRQIMNATEAPQRDRIAVTGLPGLVVKSENVVRVEESGINRCTMGCRASTGAF